MTSKEQKLVFSQFVKLIIDSRNLINFLNREFTSDYKDNILSLVNSINNTLNKYYMNFDICDQCGHPQPMLPNKAEADDLEELVNNYISLYELKTGDDLDNLFIDNQKSPQSKTPATNKPTQKVITLPDDIKDKAKQADKTIHIKGTLIKVGK